MLLSLGSQIDHQLGFNGKLPGELKEPAKKLERNPPDRDFAYLGFCLHETVWGRRGFAELYRNK